ncbi:hypothetical protein HHK36_004180 [Tetracentron sinense]|uniref:BZIP domain-containing protein n=1 Tax=Tetracentron sinense TaxID=13715 RepID=A0A834ZUS0_TETSI|nr:hypothetical protein HHK36_004180 [Tetracentron sinense]
MASSKVMASSTSVNSDLARQSSIYSLTIAELQNDPSKNFGSMSMDELLKNIYGENPAAEVVPDAGNGEANGGGTLSRQGSFSLPKNVGNKTVEEVWKEIMAGGDDRKIRAVEEGEPPFGEMTLEDFLQMAGAVREEDVRIPPTVVEGQEIYAVDTMMSNRFQQQQEVEGQILGLGNGGGGRGKRRAVHEPIDRVAQQRQRRMIKNRESAARSRERKQAYTNELETLVTQLEEENARLVREQEEQTKERLKQLMENLIPVEEKQRSPRILRRVRSLQW